MAKKKNSRPLHFKISNWIEKEVRRWLDPQFEVLIDIHFRAKSSPLGPAGWAVIVQRTHLGKAHQHGLNFPLAEKPTAKDVQAAVKVGREALDAVVAKSESLIVKPTPAQVPSDILRG